MNDALLKRLGKNLRLERNAQGKSQEQFAEILDVHRTRVGALERGKVNPTLRTVERLADQLGIDPSDLFRP